jgi:phosphohistidine swiveling domain-containing protein/glycosyltransferase involved in cell wall biosynthesis
LGEIALKTLVLVPVFNEERTVKEVLEQIWQYTSADILVVNDGSTDDSLARITESNVTYVINHESNMGPGAALISGFKFAVEHDYAVVVTLDADGQHEARYIPELLSAIGDVDMVVGSRYLLDSQRKSRPPRDREHASQALNKLVRRYTGYNVTDCASGFRAYKVSSIRKLRVTEKGYTWPFQLWIQACKAGLKVKEVPIPLIYLDYERDSHGEFRSMKQAIERAKQIMEKEIKETRRGKDAISKGIVIWTRDNVGEIIPDVITPLSWSILDPIVNKAFLHLHNQLGISDSHIRFLDRFYGRGYINRSALESILDKFTCLKPTAMVKTCWLACILPLQIRQSLFIVPKEVGRLKRLNMKGLLTDEILNRIDNLTSLMESCMTTHIACTIMGDAFVSLLRNMIRKRGGKYSKMPYSILLTGLSGMRSAEPGIELWKLSRDVSPNGKIRECIINGEPSKIFSALDAFDDGKEFAYRIKGFMKRYGHFSLQEFELSYPRWEDDPTFVLKILKSYVTSENLIDPLIFESRQRVKRLRATQKIRKEFARSKYAFPYRRLIFDLVLFEVQHCVVWRENMKQNTVLVCNQLRRCYVELANRLVDRSLLEEEDDIYFLNAEEIRRISSGKVKTEIIKEIISSRKRERETNLKLPFPSVIEAGTGSKGEIRENEEAKGLTSNITLKGIGCSIGRITGKARVILDPAKCEKLQEGEIIVAPFTNPSWTPLFVTARAVITEVGGVTSHGAVVAREYGIPCVVNVRNATKIIKNGATLTVDGEKGIVYLGQLENT